MIMMGQIASLYVYVRDLEEALRFYTDQIGFEKRSAMGTSSDARWLTVAPAGEQTEVVLIAPTADGPGRRANPMAMIGAFTGIVFSTDDIAKEYHDLSGRGVTFAHPPKREGWGTWAQFEDPDGNTFVLMESTPLGVS